MNYVCCALHCAAAHTTGAPDLQNCELCYTNKGPFVMCSAKGCNIQFHALCGRTLGTYLQVEPNWAASQIRKVRVCEVPGACVFKAVTVAVLAQVVGDDASVLPTQVTYCPAHTDTFARAAAAAAVRQPYVTWVRWRVGIAPLMRACWVRCDGAGVLASTSQRLAIPRRT